MSAFARRMWERNGWWPNRSRWTRLPTGGTGSGSAGPRGQPSATTATGVTGTREAEGAAGLPRRPQCKGRDAGAQPAGRGRQGQILDSRKRAAVERGRADRREHRTAAAYARHDQDRHVFEVVGFPLPGREQRVFAGAAVQDSACRSTSPAGRCAPAGGERRGRGTTTNSQRRRLPAVAWPASSSSVRTVSSSIGSGFKPARRNLRLHHRGDLVELRHGRGGYPGDGGLPLRGARAPAPGGSACGSPQAEESLRHSAG